MRETYLNRAMDDSKVETPCSRKSLFPSLNPHSKGTPPFSFSYLRKAKHPLLSESSCQQRDNISRDDNVDIGSNSCRPSDFHLPFKREIFLQQREEPFNGLALLVDPFKLASRSKNLHLLREAVKVAEIERPSISSFPTACFEKTFASLLDKGTAKFYPLSSLLLTPVKKLTSCWTKDLTFRRHSQLREEGGMFRVSRIGSDKRFDLVFLRKGDVCPRIIAGISDSFFHPNFLQGVLQERLKELSIKGLTRADFHRSRERKVGRDNGGMKFVAKKVFALFFRSPASISVRRKFLLGISLHSRGIHGQRGALFVSSPKSLGDEILQNLPESVFPNSFFKDSEGVMRRGLTVGESAEIAQASIETKLPGKFSLGTGFSKRNQKQGLEEAHRVKAFSSQGCFGNKRSNEREVNGGKDFLQRIVLRDILGNNPISKTRLFSFHDLFSLKEVIQKQNSIYLFNYQYVN